MRDPRSGNWMIGGPVLVILLAMLVAGYLLRMERRTPEPKSAEGTPTTRPEPTRRPRPTTRPEATEEPHTHDAPEPTRTARRVDPDASIPPAERFGWPTPENQTVVEDTGDEPPPGAAAAVVPPPSRPREESPIRVEQGESGVTISSLQQSRTLEIPTPNGVQRKDLKIEGFEVTVTGPGEYRKTRQYGVSDFAVLGKDPNLPDGLYKYEVTPQLQRIRSLSKGSRSSGDTVVFTPNGRNALDPNVVAAAGLPPLESSYGTFRIMNGQLVQPGVEAPYPGMSDSDDPGATH